MTDKDVKKDVESLNMTSAIEISVTNKYAQLLEEENHKMAKLRITNIKIECSCRCQCWS